MYPHEEGYEGSELDSQDTQNGDLWKKFGRGNDVGKMLYSMYSAKDKPKINYPKLKSKTKKPTPAEEAKMPKNNGPCPSKTVIEYPEMPHKQRYKFHPVDFIPRLKHEQDIKPEIEKMRRKPAEAYGPRGKDRNKMIEELQEINRFGDKKHLDAALFKERQMRADMLANPPQVDNKQRLRKKYDQQIAVNAMKHYEEKFGKNPAAFLLSQPKTVEQARGAQDRELQDLFD